MAAGEDKTCWRDHLEAAKGDQHYRAAWEGYLDLVRGLAQRYTSPRLLEVGGGRLPSLNMSEVDDLGATYTVNDIDENELALAPSWVDRLAGDIAGEKLFVGDGYKNKYDLIFSHMVFEHVASPAAAYRNLARLVAPGGVVVNFVPTLYAIPFVLNRLLPEKLSREILRRSFPARDLDEAPKFPAYYRWCKSTDGVRNRIERQGFSDVEVVPYYGHDYYSKFRSLQALEDAWWPVARRYELKAASTYAFIVCEGKKW